MGGATSEAENRGQVLVRVGRPARGVRGGIHRQDDAGMIIRKDVLEPNPADRDDGGPARNQDDGSAGTTHSRNASARGAAPGRFVSLA